MAHTYYTPELGSKDEQAEVVELLCSVGDTFAEGDELMVLTTDKAAFSLEATDSGKVERLFVHSGDKVSSGAALLEYSQVP